MLQLLKLAPLADSYDFFIWILILLTPLLWIPRMLKSSKSGSVEKVKTWYQGGYKWVDSPVNVPFYKTGQFAMMCLHFVLTQGFFWALMWPDHKDVWFI